jgi:hypothetical protein
VSIKNQVVFRIEHKKKALSTSVKIKGERECVCMCVCVYVGERGRNEEIIKEERGK